jgi:hypothetical protein
VTVTRYALFLLFVSTLSINFAQALPIDWSGVFGADTHLISNTCKSGDNVTKVINDRTGTQGISGDCNASFQTYVFKLNPQMIVNDGVTLKGEFSTGHIRGGFAGDNSANNQDGSGNNSYFFTTPAQRSSLNVNQMYMELYADTALVKIGRMSKHYGLGIVFDDGNDPWDRFLTMYDGIDAEMKVGNFSLIPYWAKISSYSETSTKAEPNGSFDVREAGVTAKYDNKNQDLVVSVLYAKRSSESKNALYNSDPEDGNAGPPAEAPASFNRGKTEITVIEPFVSKKWNKLKVSAEASLQSGDYGKVYDNTIKSSLSSQAYILDAKYELNPKWEIGAVIGQVSGDDGSSDEFEASYLHPNFHVADFMFRYNYAAFSEGGRSIFDASIMNTRFYKFHANYKSDKWTWKTAFIMASAMETAQGGSRAYHHEESYSFDAGESQSDNLGWELDFGFDYRWNPNVTISGYYGYWKVGDYYSFTNTTDTLSLNNMHGGGVKATLEF